MCIRLSTCPLLSQCVFADEVNNDEDSDEDDDWDDDDDDTYDSDTEEEVGAEDDVCPPGQELWWYSHALNFCRKAWCLQMMQ